MIKLQTAPNFDLKLGNFTLADCRPEVQISGASEVIRWQSAAPGEYHGESAAGTWEYRVQEQGGKIILQLTAHLHAPVEQAEFTVLSVPEIAANHLFVEGLRMGSCHLKQLTKPAEAAPFESFYHILLTAADRTLMLSMPLRQKQPGHFTGETGSGKVTNFRAGYEVKFFSGTDIVFDPITLEVGNGFDLLNAWGTANIEVKKEFPLQPPVGWNSWDYYRWTITEDEVLKNADFIAHDPVLSKYVKRIIVDDGWQYCYGEWEANHYFPHGMKFLAQELTKMGFEPGLWFAPTIVEPQSPIAQYHPEMLGLSRGGQPCLCYKCMERQGFVLDPTVPQVQAHLRTLFDRYADMGYKYFKLDFLQSTLAAEQFHDRAVSRTDIVRKAVEAVYEGVAGRAQILGCNYPFLAGNKYVDTVRIGSDIHAMWDFIKLNTVSVAARFWANRKFWLNDPDFSLCRGVDTSDDPLLNALNPCWVGIRPDMPYNAEIDNFKMGTATKSEIEILLGIVLMNAGAVNFSDKMPLLNEAGLRLARRLVTARPAWSGRPLDLFKSELPAQWEQQLQDGGRRFMLINWQDKPQTCQIEMAQHGFTSPQMVDFYAEAPVELPLVPTAVTLPPHSCKIWETR